MGASRLGRHLASASPLTVLQTYVRMAVMSLHDALRLTLRNARRNPERFERFARRWLERFIGETEASLKLISWIADDLEKIGMPECPYFIRQEAEQRMRRLQEALRETGEAPSTERLVGYGKWGSR